MLYQQRMMLTIFEQVHTAGYGHFKTTGTAIKTPVLHLVLKSKGR